MTRDEKRALAEALGALYELERFAGCSDRYFRQVFTAKLRALRASGLREALLSEIEAGEGGSESQRERGCI